MLTKQDLNAIGTLIDTKLESKFEEKLTPIHNDIKTIKKDVGELKTNVTNLQKDMTIVKKDVIKLQNNILIVDNGVKKLDSRLTKTINFFDNAEMDTRSKINKTRKDLGLNEVEFAY